jgi:glutaminyl-tRNA synthetase
MRRRGYLPESIRKFCAEIGVAKNDNLIDISLLEHCVREDLNVQAPRVLCVLRPLRVVIDNYPENQVEQIECANHPQNPAMGTRQLTFSKVLYIEQDDFQENPPKKYHRLGPGREVRLRNAYIVKFENMVKDETTGEVIELHCTYDPHTRNAPPADGHKVPGVIHWVSAQHCVPAQARLYNRLFSIGDPGSEPEDFIKYLNPGSLEILTNCYAELSLKNAEPGSKYQFERLGYFCVDTDASAGQPVFNRIVPLRDSWMKTAGEKKD